MTTRKQWPRPFLSSLMVCRNVLWRNTAVSYTHLECPNAELLTNSQKIEITARDITITLAPENSGAVRLEDINGEQWIFVKAEGDIQINGVSCRKG